MFNAKYFKDLINQTPFRAFKIRLTNGSTYAVPNHDAAFVMQNHLEVGLDLNQDGIAQRSVRCALLHIAEVEELQPA